ncbi:MAG: pilus assembly protein [bacterium]|nr:pilus assembly protein [bacterium]
MKRRGTGAICGPGARQAQQGQATVELALLMPLLMVVALFLAQLALAARDQIMVTHSAREAARAVAVSNDAGVARTAALAASRLDPQRLRVHVEEPPGTANVAVRLDYRSPVRFAPLGIVLDDLVLSGEAIMRSER